MLKMLVTDLDGTLLNNQQQVDPRDYQTLIELGRSRIIRVVATGRSPYSFRKLIPDNFPIDYLVFSSGSGVMDWSTKELLVSQDLDGSQIDPLISLFYQHHLPFKLLHPSPDNHRFWFYQNGYASPDFLNRLDIYERYGTPIQIKRGVYQKASQFLLILPDDEDFFLQLKAQCKGVKVIRATSPLDHQSIWMEVFPEHVSKGYGMNYLLDRCGITLNQVAGIGNDYNDIDFLDLCEHAYMVSNGPERLKAKYKTAPSNEEAAIFWLSQELDML